MPPLARSPGSNEMNFTSNRRQFLFGAAASTLAITAAGGIGRAFAQDQQLVFWSQLAGSKKAAGEALEPGRMRQVVRVRNSSTGRVIRARVLGDGVVEPEVIASPSVR